MHHASEIIIIYYKQGSSWWSITWIWMCSSGLFSTKSSSFNFWMYFPCLDPPVPCAAPEMHAVTSVLLEQHQWKWCRELCNLVPIPTEKIISLSFQFIFWLSPQKPASAPSTSLTSLNCQKKKYFGRCACFILWSYPEFSTLLVFPYYSAHYSSWVWQ